MKNVLQRAWRQVLIMGILNILFGILSFIWPGITLLTLVYLFAFFAIAEGISIMSGAWSSRKEGDHWFWLFVVGIIYVLGGCVAIFYSGITALFLVILTGVQALLAGIFEIVAAIRLRKEIQNEGWLILSGVISVIFGLWVVFLPGAGALALIWLIATFSLVLGIMLVLLALKARNWVRQHVTPAAA